MLKGLNEDISGIVEFHEIGRNMVEELHVETLGIVEYNEVGWTLLERLCEKILSIVEFHEVRRAFLEGLHEDTFGIVEFLEVGGNFLEVLHEVLLAVVFYEVGILYLLAHNNLLHSQSLHEVVRKLPPGLPVVILHCRYRSYVLNFYFTFETFCVYIFFFHFCYLFYFTGYFGKEEPIGISPGHIL